MVKGTIIIDTREKIGKNSHVEDYFKKNDIPAIRSKLYVGDYSYVNDMSICIDRKQSILEMVSNVVGDHDRMVNEIKRSNDAGIQLVYLIEDERISSLQELYSWHNPRTRTSPRCTQGRTLAKSLETMKRNYGIKVYFTRKDDCGENIIKILNKESME